jgi:osmoprotectant transport system permease protein
VRVAARLGFENAYAFAMRRTDAARRGVRRLSDLGPVSPRLSLGTDYEFLSRPEWRSAQRAYDLRFRAERSMDPSLMYQAAAAGQVDVISAFSTDGRIEAFDLVTLDDDRQAIPPYDAVVLVSPRLVRDRPDVVAALEDLEETIPVDAMRAMNLAVDQEGRLPGAVAREFLAGLPANVSAR